MSLKEYNDIALQRLNKTISNNSKESMYYACMGLIEETGEIIAELRKPLFEGNFHQKCLEKEKIQNELGDLMWYIVLMCKNCNISIEDIEDCKISLTSNGQLPTRERMIQVAINMGQITGQIVENALKEYDTNIAKEELVIKMSEQYKNIDELATLLDITMEQILDTNIRKINSRYNRKGDVSR